MTIYPELVGKNVIQLPSITDERLMELHSKITTIVKEGMPGSEYSSFHILRLYTLEELRTRNFLTNLENDSDVEDTKRLHIHRGYHENYLAEFDCLHTIKEGCSKFVPTVAEVLAQMPDSVTEEADGFIIVQYPKTIEEFTAQKEFIINGYHSSKVRTYARKNKP